MPSKKIINFCLVCYCNSNTKFRLSRDLLLKSTLPSTQDLCLMQPQGPCVFQSSVNTLPCETIRRMQTLSNFSPQGDHTVSPFTVHTRVKRPHYGQDRRLATGLTVRWGVSRAKVTPLHSPSLFKSTVPSICF